jgi:hypothetical protein
MSGRRRMCGLLAGSLLALGGCGGEDGPSAQLPMSSPTATSMAPSPEDVAAEAALAVFRDALRVTDQASKDPAARDWEPEIRQHMGDPAAFLATQTVRDYAALELRQEGDSAVTTEVDSVDLAAPEGPTVRITGCFDSQSTKLLDAETGQVVLPGTPPRYVWDVAVTQFAAEAGEPWLVTVLEPMTDQPC